MPTAPHRVPRKQSLRGWILGRGVARSAGVVYHPKPRQRVARVTSNSTAVIAKEGETLKTLSYDCGNPVQYVCGHPPAVLFYLLDRHAPLAMTKGTKWIIPQSLTTPAASRHPSNGGELGTLPSRSKFPSRGKFPFTTDGAATPIPLRNKVHLCGRIWLLSLVLLRSKFPSAEGWHEAAGWFITRSLGEGWFIAT